MLFVFAVVLTGLGTVALLAFRVDAFARGLPAPTKAKAIIVLGARVLPSGEASPALRRRAEKAAELYLQGLAPVVIFSGGAFGALPSEASVARNIAIKLGVPPEVCVLEENSDSTFQNAQLTAPLLQARKIDEVLLVSDGYHLLRASLHFARLNIGVQVVASERASSSADHVYRTVREAIALLRRPSILWR